MNLIFTICSNNYLAQAKVLGDSLMNDNSSYRFIIVLVDRLNDAIDYKHFHPYEVIPIEDLHIDGFDEMFARYNITELNTSVKPFIFNFLFSRNQDSEAIIYLDPDIVVYDRFTDLENCMVDNNIVITPHFFTPINDQFTLTEASILNAGLYNLGFLAVTRSEESNRFLNWWMIRLKDQCYIDFKNGLFVDQIWINFVTLYFDKVFILRHLGYNMAYWNLHERTITSVNGKYFVNERFPLVFFHFSGYEFKKADLISKYQNRYSFDQREDIVPLFKSYYEAVMSNNLLEYSSVPCYFVLEKQRIEREKVDQELSRFPKGLKHKLKRKLKSLKSRFTL